MQPLQPIASMKKMMLSVALHFAIVTAIKHDAVPKYAIELLNLIINVTENFPVSLNLSLINDAINDTNDCNIYGILEIKPFLRR